MGYYTIFQLEVFGLGYRMSADEEEHTIKKARKMSEDLAYVVGDDGGSGDSSKWYDWDKNMKKISGSFPNVVFHLQGEGEEGGDLWHAYFCNGQIQKCKAVITFEEFDENKFREVVSHLVNVIHIKNGDGEAKGCAKMDEVDIGALLTMPGVQYVIEGDTMTQADFKKAKKFVLEEG